MKSLLLSSALVLSLAASAALAADWPHPRGPEVDGRVSAPGIFEAGAIALDLSWRTELGSAYSGIAVAAGRAVTMFADDEADWIVALDAATGKELWRRRIGDLTKGQDGSDDGPLSSPVIGDGKVYALAPGGRLLALSLDDGEVAWSKQLDEEYGAQKPHFGFTTTPLVEGNVLIVQAGGTEGRAVVGLDRKTGKQLWSRGDEKIDYQSPAVMTLAGERQVVTVGGSGITGLAAHSGELLWEHPLGEDDRASSANPTFIGEDRFLVFMSGGATAYRVSRSEERLQVEELYRSEALGRTYAAPVYRDGHVYGFRGQVLTCMNAASGERVWRSRPPGGDGLIAVDDYLVIFGAKGNVVVADASPEGYRERARQQALEGSSLSWPAFADGRVFVRNLNSIAAVAVTRGRSVSIETATAGDHEFGAWVRKIQAAENRGAMVDELLERHERWPIVEGEYVHFLYRSEANDVSISGSMHESETLEPMRRIEGTDLFHRTYRLEPGIRWEYQFQVDFEGSAIDPHNPRAVPALEGDDQRSELITPGYRAADHVAEPSGRRGRIDRFELSSEALGYAKQIKVWLPPGYDDSGRSYPLLLVNDGHAWLDRGLMSNALDNLVGKRIEPVVVAFVDASERWWLEAGGSRTDDYVAMQVEELLPALEERYRLEAKPGSRAIMGGRFYALSSAYAALKHPEIFGVAALQSIYTGLGVGDDLAALIREGTGKSVRFYLDWNRYDERNIDRDYDFADDSRTLADLLVKGGYTMAGGEVADSAGWGGWRNRYDRVLASIFPVE